MSHSAKLSITCKCSACFGVIELLMWIAHDTESLGACCPHQCYSIAECAAVSIIWYKDLSLASDGFNIFDGLNASFWVITKCRGSHDLKYSFCKPVCQDFFLYHCTQRPISEAWFQNRIEQLFLTLRTCLHIKTIFQINLDWNRVLVMCVQGTVILPQPTLSHQVILVAKTRFSINLHPVAIIFDTHLPG